MGLECVFACDIDQDARNVYERNFGLRPEGDVKDIPPASVPGHDILFAGLPCQPFSIIGKRQGFADSRGNLFLEAARIIAAKSPKIVVIENVRQFAPADQGRSLSCVQATLQALGYEVESQVLNALDFGLPQKRERILIVAREPASGAKWEWPRGGVKMKPLAEVLEPNPARRHYASARIRRARHAAHKASVAPSIWHENKGGNISSHPWSCALRAGASYNYLLVNGERRLTPREMFRLQGFPDTFEMPDTDCAARRLTGNAVAVPVAKAVIGKALHAI
ncbi:MAG: Modification methylase HhaI [Verrucomicrobia subdivision 3 bacterium]|nr:Modification methylase HhaI [Limisphaerales bacterium]MCS1417894.1 Modification methylase HhaI [Limisphaerales bacterium]